MKRNIIDVSLLIEKIKSLKEEVRNRYKAEIIGIFGAYARGDVKKRSNLDLLVKFYGGSTLFEFVAPFVFFDEKLKIKKVNVVPFDTIRDEIKDRILKEVRLC